MGNLEKVLIVIILATIAVITALAFLDSGDDLGNLRDERSSGASRAGSSFERAVREAEDRARADEENRAAGDETSDDESELETFFRGRTESTGETPDDDAVDPNAAAESETTDPTTAPGRAGANDTTPGEARERIGDDTTPETAGSNVPAPEPDPVDLRTTTKDPRSEPRTKENSGVSRATLRTDRGYVLGSRRYTSAEGDTWTLIADIVYGDPELAWAVREANTDVRREPLPAGVALYIVPHEEIDRSRAPSRDDSGSETSEARIHLVEKDETLSGIARQYYGREARWKEIFEANRDQLVTERDLRPGMRIRIP